MLLVFPVQFLSPPLISGGKEGKDRLLIASVPTAAHWSADKVAIQEKPHTVLRAKVTAMLSADQRTSV